MLNRRTLLTGGAALGALTWFSLPGRAAAPATDKRFQLTPQQWKARLSPVAFTVLREEGTERPFTSPLNDEHRSGIFVCGGCALPLYSARTKFDSGTGWPSFWAALPKATATSTDRTLGIARVEEHCLRCGGHLGHIFDDGPKPTGKRHCINGVALKFVAGKA